METEETVVMKPIRRNDISVRIRPAAQKLLDELPCNSLFETYNDQVNFIIFEIHELCSEPIGDTGKTLPELLCSKSNLDKFKVRQIERYVSWKKSNK